MRKEARIQASAELTPPVSTIVPHGAKVSSISTFNDFVWDRKEYALTRTLELNFKIDWLSLYGKHWDAYYPVIVSFMEFAYASLYDPAPDQKVRDSGSVKQEARLLISFIDYLQSRNIYHLADLTHQDIYGYVEWLINQNKRIRPEELCTLEEAARRVRVLQVYYWYAKRVSHPLPVHPLHGESLFKFLGKRRPDSRENKTPRIPKEIWDPYLCAALDYVEIYATDILKGQELLEGLRTDTAAKYSATKPGYRLSRAGISKMHVMPAIARLTDFAVHSRTGLPWRSGWDLKKLRDDLYALYAACVVVIGSLSGMRESELALIGINGFEQDKGTAGTPSTYYLTSRLVKGKNNKSKRWVVNEPVYQACVILKQLTSYARKESGIEDLFMGGWYRTASAEIDASSSAEGNTGSGNTEVRPLRASAMQQFLNLFACHIQTTFADLYSLPLVDGKPWHFTTRQLRRSLACRIAREPFGVIAGMLHYKHIKLTTFLGYAGTDPTWLDELHDEELAANDEFLSHILEDLEDGTLAGGKGIELVRDFKGLAGEVKKNAMQYFLESSRANLHVGLFNYCLFQKESALCLPEKDSARNVPNLNACHPDRCANSCISTGHLPQWEVQIEDAKAMLNHPNVSQPQRIALTKDLEKAVRIVSQLKGSHE